MPSVFQLLMIHFVNGMSLNIIPMELELMFVPQIYLLKATASLT